MRDSCKQFVADILAALEEERLPAEKVFLHKFLYFLSTQGVNTGFRFEPYTYGPYSFDLASTLGSMAFWDEIEEKGTTVKALDLGQYKNSDEQFLDVVRSKLKIFLSLTGGSVAFDKLECLGTVLYCAEVIANHGDDPTEQAVLKEFKAWKKNKYPDDQVLQTFRNISDYLPRPTNRLCR